MAYRFKVWNADHVAHNCTATLAADRFGFCDTVALFAETYKDAVELKKRLKKSYISGRGWNTNNPDKYLSTLCWPK